MLSGVRKAECDLSWFLTALPSHQEVSLNPCRIEEGVFWFFVGFLRGAVCLFVLLHRGSMSITINLWVTILMRISILKGKKS